MEKKSYNTNLASEFYVLSMLHRIGASAYMTLGNKKSVDIIIEKNNKIMTIDVKGIEGITSFPIENWNKKDRNHFLIFVSFKKKIKSPDILPDVFIIPSMELESLSVINDYSNTSTKRKVVGYHKLKNNALKYKNKWSYFE